jgi:hypothetical protein
LKRLLLAVAMLCGCARPGVELTVAAAPELSDATVAAIRTLDLDVRGDEQLQRTLDLGRSFSPSREERLLYLPQPQSIALRFTVAALDAKGALVAIGQTNVMPRSGQAVSARVELFPMGASPVDGGDTFDMGGALDSGGAADQGHAPPDLASPADGGNVVPLNAGDTCRDAPELPIGVDVPNQSTTPLHDDYSAEWKVNSVCNQTSLSYSPGRDGVYRLTIPAGKTLKVTLTTGSGSSCYHWPFEPDLFLFTDCANVGASCLFCALAQDIEHTVLQYKNAGARALPLFLAVDQAYSFADGYGCYSLRADLM